MHIEITRRFEKDLIRFASFRAKIVDSLEVFEKNPGHPSLRIEKLRPKAWGIYSIRINKQLRVLFTWKGERVVMLEISQHYE